MNKNTKIKLYDYQEAIAQDHSKKMLLMEAGTGKTFTALRRWQLSAAPNLLVICLAAKRSEWLEDLMLYNYSYDVEHVTRNNTFVLRGRSGEEKVRESLKTDLEMNAAIVSFESANLIPSLLDWVAKDTFVIIDESHKLKNGQSKMTRSIRKLVGKAYDQVLLTATPQSQGYIDYFSQLQIAGYKPWQRLSRKEWIKAYATTRKQNMGGFSIDVITGYKRTDVLDRVINSISAYHTLPYGDIEPVTRVLDVPFNRTHAKMYKDLITDRVYTDGQGNDHIYDTMGALYMAERQAAQGVFGGEQVFDDRIKYAKMLLEDELLNERVIIFYNFDFELKALRKVVNELKRPLSEYNGHTKETENFEKYDNAVVLVNYGSGSTGLNWLVKAHHTIFYSLPNSHITFHQAKKRTDRIGQTKTPVYHVMLASRTVEKMQWVTLKSGRKFDEELYEKYMRMPEYYIRKFFIPNPDEGFEAFKG